MPKSYPPEFRCRVVELCRAGAQPSRVAADLGSLKPPCTAGSPKMKWTPENGRESAAASTLSFPERVHGSESLKPSSS
jgi:hypothetical protein